MSLFQCDVCGCCENTSFVGVGKFKLFLEDYDWSYAPDRRGKQLCCVCGPRYYKDGNPLDYCGKWHNEFPRIFLPLGMFVTNAVGNLAHAVTGDENFGAYSLPCSAAGPDLYL